MLRGLEGCTSPRIPSVHEDDAADKTQQDFTDFFPRPQKTTAPRRRRSARPCGALEGHLLRVVDEYWMDHMTPWTRPEAGHPPAAYANTDPVIAYKQESLTMFEEMPRHPDRDGPPHLRPAEEGRGGQGSGQGMVKTGGDGTAPKKQPVKVNKIGRNDPCPAAGLAKKYRKSTLHDTDFEGSRPSTFPTTSLRIANAPKALRSKYFRHVRCGEMIEFLDLPSADQLWKPGWVSSPFSFWGASPHSPLYLLSFVFSFLSLPLLFFSCRRGRSFHRRSRRG